MGRKHRINRNYLINCLNKPNESLKISLNVENTVFPYKTNINSTAFPLNIGLRQKKQFICMLHI